ncbi:hypothetical protein OH76DRAFT_1354186 [Lentinus brumalis]|uniref:UbiA prenyltransferase n=1 Tax=Lentinus brumalis TaxID=2498619 RepID=A0A371D4P4_9APHY|nr:hypothetical protein OH76DRAFT_1354186 [Polyporus brumalis]
MSLLRQSARLLAKVPYFLHTCFLFTKSDMKTTVVPVSSLAAASAPLSDISRLVHIVFWVWLHVLQFDVSNQTMDPDEDEMNKRDRPLPAKRITLQQALFFRWLLVPICWAYSALYSIETLYASMALVALTVIYDELGAHRMHWAIRNLVNALGFCAFETGATLVAAGRDPTTLDGVALWSIAASTGIFFTTIHSQDFKDVDGDRAIGRQTIPIVFGALSRFTVIVPLLLWSVGLSVVWGLDIATCATFVVLGLFVGAQYVVGKSVHEYQVAFYWYNLWLSAAHSLPAYYRIYYA